MGNDFYQSEGCVMADIPKTINVFLRENQVSKQIVMLNGGNGSAKKLFPGYPDLWDRYKTMGIKDIRTHDRFGLSDADTNI